MLRTKKHLGKYEMIGMIFALAWPTMLEQLMQAAVQYVDTAMVGGLGTDATAAVGATTTISWLLMGSLSALGVGFLAYIAKAYGAKEYARAARASGQAVLVVLVMGSLFTALTVGFSRQIPVWMQVDPSVRDLTTRYFFILYLPMLPRAATIIFSTVLRAVGDTKTPMRTGLLINFINVVLNFLLIYPFRTLSIWNMTIPIPGAGLGVEGAAMASAAAFLIGSISITAALWKHPVISPRGQKLSPDMEVLRPCLQVALPNMLQRFGTYMGYVVAATMINALGGIATAAHTIANTVESLFYIPGYGMQTAAAMLAGNALGARDKKRMRSIGRTLIPIVIVLMTVSGGLLFAFAEPLMKLFSSQTEVIHLGTTVLRIVAVTEPFFGVSIIIEGMMQGVGKTGTPFVYNIIGMWFIRIVGIFLCTRVWGFGFVSTWVCMIAHNLLLFCMFMVHYLRGKWDPLRTESSCSYKCHMRLSDNKTEGGL